MNGKRVDRFILSVLRTPEDNLYALGVEILRGEKVSSRISRVEEEPVFMLKSPGKSFFQNSPNGGDSGAPDRIHGHLPEQGPESNFSGGSRNE